jgi:hypothetical protein
VNEGRRRIRRSREQEKKTAATYRGSVTSGSGNGWVNKGDVRTEHILFENKRTDNVAQITVKVKDLLLLEKQALMQGRMGVLQFEVGGRSYNIVTDEDFQTLIGGVDGEV